MKVRKFTWAANSDFAPRGAGPEPADFVLYFGSRERLSAAGMRDALATAFPGAVLFGCSSGGQIDAGDVTDDTIAGVAIKLERSAIRAAEVEIAGSEQTRDSGRALARALDAPDLSGLLVLSDGLRVNGSELVAGLVETLGKRVPICGGLAGDGAAFEETLVGLEGAPRPGIIGALGFYGDAIRIGHGSAGGWNVFGPSRIITKSRENMLMELDGQPALDLYERYLCPEDIAGLPGTALLFPLLIRNPADNRQDLVRTVLAIDRKARTMTFAGDMPVGWSAQLMRSTFEHLSAGAAEAAARAAAGAGGDCIALMISCMGRRIMMGQRVTDEIEAACAQLPAGATSLGFYSYGEISPHPSTGYCELHNQTMTVMTLAEHVP